LRGHPNLRQLKRQAKELLEAFAARGPHAVAEVNAHYPDADPANFALHHAQFVLARSYGFDSWPKLKAYVEGVTAGSLCDAVDRGDVAVVRDLLRRRPEIVNLEWPGRGEYRALHVAVLRRDAAMVRVLMEHGADARRGIWPNRDATSALRIAVERGYNEIAAIIHEEERRRGASQEAAPSGLRRELEEAMESEDQKRAISILEADPALMHESRSGGWTLLHEAAGMLRQQVVAWLLVHGADVNRRAGEWTPLDFAASGRAWETTATPERFAALAEQLRRHGAELTAVSAVALGEADWIRTRHSEGALGSATNLDLFAPFGGLLSTDVRHNRPEMLSLLLDLGLDPDERVRLEGADEVGWSWGLPLHLCASSGKLAMAEMLLRRGADPNGQVCASGSPTYAAYSQKDWAMVKLLERHGGALDAASVGYLRQTELARKMLAGEVDARLGFGMFSGQTVAEQLLWSGASGGDPEIVRMALQHIHWPRDDRRWFWMLWRPLPGHSIRPEPERAGYLACFRLVLERCDANLRAARDGQTMLHEVVARDHQEGVGFAGLLLEAGARLDVRDHLLQSTPLGWACRWGRIELARLLLEHGADPVEPGAEPWATPQAWAGKMGRDDVLALLRKYTH
jgi:ankyrin repeat protein